MGEKKSKAVTEEAADDFFEATGELGDEHLDSLDFPKLSLKKH